MSRIAMLALMGTLGTVPVFGAEINVMEDMDKNYVQLSEEGWEEIGGIDTSGTLLMKKKTKRAVCNMSDTGRLLAYIMSNTKSEDEYTLSCYLLKTGN